MRRAALLVLLASCKHGEAPKPEPDAAAAPVVVDAAPAVTGSKVRTGAPGDTKGTISCGRVRCKAESEACVRENGLWACAALTAAPTANDQFQCDDGSDCTTPGWTCCTNDRHYASCSVMRAVDSDPCNFEVCSTDPGASSCPKGQSCVDGICRPPPSRATCAAKKSCPPEAPNCAWTDGAGHCVADAGLECTRPSDCGPGFTCCTQKTFGDDAIAGTHCQAGCGTDLEVVCEKTAECPGVYATGANPGLLPQKCTKRAPSGDYPTWSGKCQ